MESIIRRVAAQIGQQELVGVLGDYPLRRGNKFTLKMCDGKWAWVQNISAEDFEEICKREKLYSVFTLYLPEHNACFIIDDRIPWNWYRYYERFNSSAILASYTGTEEDTDPIITCPYIPVFFTEFSDDNNTSVQQLEIKFEGDTDESS